MEAGVGAVGQQAGVHAEDCGPLPADLVLGATPVLKEPRLLGGHLFWLEQLPAERGRTTLRLRSHRGSELDLTPELDLRSRIHGYGGGVYCVACDTAVVVAEGGRSLWRLDLPGEIGADVCSDPEPAAAAASSPASAASRPAASLAEALQAPVRLTPEPPSGGNAASHEPTLFGDGLIDLARRRWVGVCEQQDRDRLVSVPLAGGAPQLLWQSPDFCGYAVLSPSGSHLAWVSWRQPCMPWQRSQLWLGRFDARGELVEARPIAGSAPGDAAASSVFQPLWAGPDLVVANDRSGWWNLEVLPDAEHLAADQAPHWRPLLPMPAEFGMPQWVYGMRTTAWDGKQLLAACCRDGRWQLGALLPIGADAGDQGTTGGALADVPIRAGYGLTTSVPGAAAASATSGRLEPDRPGEHAQPAFREGIQPPATEAAAIAVAGTEANTADPGRADAAETGTTGAVSETGARAADAQQAALRWQPIPLPFDDLAALDAENGRLVAIASGPVDGPGLLELTLFELTRPDPARLDPTRQEPGAETLAPSRPDDIGCRWTHRPAAPAVLTPGQISRPEPLWFAGHGGLPTHAWYYPPQGGASPGSPLLLRGHSGPTGMARTGLSLSIQYWTSRGWGVVDVNYGGSTGFGRAYRERLDGLWGVVDVDDCLAAAAAVVEAGRADPDRIAMEGSSASGFTVLAAMARGSSLRAGSIRYPVTDLKALAEGDHRFEARYFDSLVGPWPEARALYEQRSPLNQVERINAPLLFFHGLDDAVVPAQQSIAMVERLKQRGVPVELVLFEGEGHGFRDAAVQRQVLERSEAFFRERFQLPDPA